MPYIIFYMNLSLSKQQFLNSLVMLTGLLL